MKFLLALSLACGGDSDGWAPPENVLPELDDTFEVSTASGLAVTVTEKGSGGKPTEGQKLQVHYHGWLAESGMLFDTSSKRNHPLSVTVGMGLVIPGWDEGLQMLEKGTQARLKVPADLGYGEKGLPPAIPPNADLVFDIWMLE